MRTITTTVVVYQLEELDASAQEKAIDAIRERLGGDWWDEHDNADVGAAMLYSLAGTLQAPGWDTFGSGDFPGIAGVTMNGWDIGRGQSLALDGTLDRDNAPMLPWVEGIAEVSLSGIRSDSTVVDVVDADPECTCAHGGWESHHEPGCPTLTHQAATDAQREVMRQVVRDAIHTAWKAGSDEADYKTSDEYTRQWIDANGCEFLSDGTLYH